MYNAVRVAGISVTFALQPLHPSPPFLQESILASLVQRWSSVAVIQGNDRNWGYKEGKGQVEASRTSSSAVLLGSPDSRFFLTCYSPLALFILHSLQDLVGHDTSSHED